MTRVHVAFVVLVRDGRALLCHRHPGRRLFPDVWDLPGGHVEPGESAEDAARREVAEELGVVVGPLAPLSVAVDTPARTDVFVALRWRGEPRNLAPDEHDEIGWFTPDAVSHLRLAVPEVADLVAMAIARAGREA